MEIVKGSEYFRDDTRYPSEFETYLLLRDGVPRFFCTCSLYVSASIDAMSLPSEEFEVSLDKGQMRLLWVERGLPSCWAEAVAAVSILSWREVRDVEVKRMLDLART